MPKNNIIVLDSYFKLTNKSHFMVNCDRPCLQYCLQWSNSLQSHSHSVTAAPLQTEPLMRHGTVTTSDTGCVEQRPTWPILQFVDDTIK